MSPKGGPASQTGAPGNLARQQFRLVEPAASPGTRACRDPGNRRGVEPLLPHGPYDPLGKWDGVGAETPDLQTEDQRTGDLLVTESRAGSNRQPELLELIPASEANRRAARAAPRAWRWEERIEQCHELKLTRHCDI